MSGETDLARLLQDMRPERNPGEYVFCVVDSYERATALRPLGIYQEKEGFTVILQKQQADLEALSYSVVCSWITLTIHSSLEAVGLTAAVSQALAGENISCNVVAAYYHDHLFVPIVDASRALDILFTLSRQSGDGPGN